MKNAKIEKRCESYKASQFGRAGRLRVENDFFGGIINVIC